MGQPYGNPAMINQYQYNQQNYYGQTPMNPNQYGQLPMNPNQYGQQGQLPLMNQPLSGSQIIYQQ